MRKEPAVVIANALIWAFVLVACSRTLGAEEYQKIQLTLGGGAAVSLLVVGVGILRRS
ncbi:MAG: hypothetical protein DHS20C21_03970 [Gemmatimonadota bacterium]|nr:MAG: hypothetical protein DHS20C21_03970 [Gemmatimonadota bacterium]